MTFKKRIRLPIDRGLRLRAEAAPGAPCALAGDDRLETREWVDA
jgi:hypothetical protein